MTDDFYVYLSSNVRNNINQNTLSNFTTFLPEKLELSEKYEVALAEISYTKSWLNIEKDEDVWITDCDAKEPKSYKIILTAGYYDESLIVKMINAMMNKRGVGDFVLVNPQLNYDENSKKFKITYGATNEGTEKPHILLPIFSYDLSEKLGFIDEKNEKLLPKNYIDFSGLNDKGQKDVVIESHFNPQINSVHTIYIYSDILNPRIVGNVKAPLFRQVEVPSKKPFGQDIHIKYKNLFYHPLNHFEINTIQIILKDDTGRDIQFKFGRISLSLHFRKINKLNKILKIISK